MYEEIIFKPAAKKHIKCKYKKKKKPKGLIKSKSTLHKKYASLNHNI